jgi:hypothetical protein
MAIWWRPNRKCRVDSIHFNMLPSCESENDHRCPWATLKLNGNKPMMLIVSFIKAGSPLSKLGLILYRYGSDDCECEVIPVTTNHVYPCYVFSLISEDEIL